MTLTARLLATAGLALATPVAHARCEPLLALLRPQAPAVGLTSCDLTAVPPVGSFAGDALAAFTLRGDALARWQRALDESGSAYAASELRIQALRSNGLRDGALLPGPSARRVEGAHWRWGLDQRLTLFAAPSPASAPPSCTQAGLAAGDRIPLILWFGERDVEPGELVVPGAFLTRHPGDRTRVEPACLGDWATLDATTLTLVAPAAGVFQVAADAPDDATPVLRARVGERRVEGRLRVVAKALRPLVGVWQQSAAYACDGSTEPIAPADPVRELAFDGQGRFTMTWMPFESKVDVTGRFTVREADGARQVVLEVTGGDPHGTASPAEGEIDAGGELVFRRWQVGHSRRPVAGAAPSVCGARFRRISG